jgi:hypothetical protein
MKNVEFNYSVTLLDLHSHSWAGLVLWHHYALGNNRRTNIYSYFFPVQFNSEVYTNNISLILRFSTFYQNPKCDSNRFYCVIN